MYISIIMITLIWRGVLPLFYLAPSNIIVLTLYISPFSLTFKKSRRNHFGKTAGMPEIRAPPRIYRGFGRL